MKTPNDQCKDDEIDLLPLIHALWKSKLKIVVAIVIGMALALAAFYALPPKWVASTYLTKGSLLSVYREVRSTETVPVSTTQPIEIRLYNSIQDDVFYVAMGIMTANKIVVAATPQPFIHLASSKASSKELAVSKLKSVLDKANTQALNLNLPSLTADHNLRAFNILGEFKVIKSKSIVAYLAIGAFLGFIAGCLLIFFPLLKAYYARATDK
jgi:chain length determinant protein (polysaccharide antigen chain regulator)